MISQETIERIRERASILDLAGESVALKRRGANYTGLCPFHSEKTPSFSVRENGDYYRCFGCGAAGNVFTYVMELRGLSFPEAVEDLAARYGIEIKQEGGGVPIKKDSSKQLYIVNAAAQTFFSKSLDSSKALIKDYVKSRGISAEGHKTFRVGFAPEGWNELTDNLLSQKFDPELLVRSGLVKRGQNGKLYDAYRGRLIFPIYQDEKRIVGFGGRVIPALVEKGNEKSVPKYINSPETEVYKKSKTFFGFPQANTAIRESGEIYLVEGYLDVVGLWQVGVRNVLATCGTAVTEEHIKRLSKLARRVIVLFDGDSAGIAAAAKIFPLSINTGIDILAKFLPDEDDPDSFALKHGSQTVELLAKMTSVPLFECYLGGIIESYGGVKQMGAASKGQIALKLAGLLSKLQNPVERGLLEETAAGKLGIPAHEFSQLLIGAAKETDRTPVKVDQIEEKSVAFASFPSLPRVDQELLRAIFTRKELAGTLLADPLVSSGLLNGSTVRFVQGLHDIFQRPISDDEKKKAVRGELLSIAGSSWMDAWREAYVMLEDRLVDMYRSFDQCRITLKRMQLLQDMNEIELESTRSGDGDERLRLEQQKLQLKRQFTELLRGNA